MVLDLNKWKALVKRAQRAMTLSDNVAYAVTGLTKKDAREVLDAEQKRLEAERTARVNRGIVRHNR